jgi:microcystin-dependent protein
MDPFVAEIRIFPFNFAPKGWAFCNGQILPISQNTALFSLLGTTYGGNGQSTFALPNLQGSAAMFWGQGPGLSLRSIGETGGSPTVTLQTTQMPLHTHTANGKVAGGTVNPGNMVWGTSSAGKVAANFYAPAGGTVNMNAGALANAGSSQPHNNMMPYQTLNYNIALQGVYPPRA